MLLVAVSLWLIARPYQGIFHDAHVYTLQALARLHPGSLGRDIFVGSGSQDAFTVFSPIYAWAIGLWGVDGAARFLTLLGHAWWGIAAWYVARPLVADRWTAWLSLALIAGLPGYYGALEVFQYAEPFVTPRVFAEAAVLTAVALWLHHRPAMAVASALLAMLLHPLMGAAGLLVITGLVLGSRGPALLASVVLGGLCVAIAMAFLLPVGPISLFDSEWLDLVRSRSPFLLMSDWNAESWEGVATSVAAMTIAVTGIPAAGRERRVLATTLLVGLLGLFITLVGATGFKVVLLTQGQGWRWTWLGLVLATLASPRVVPTHWRHSDMARSALLVFASSWVLKGWPAVWLAALAVPMIVLRERIPRRPARWTLLASTALALVSGALWLLNRPTFDTLLTPYEIPLPLYGLSLFAADGAAPAAIAVLAWLGIRRAKSRGIALAGAAVTAAMIGTLARADLGQTYFDGRDYTAAAAWRASIPEAAEVFWPTDPTSSWILLERRSFVSSTQTAGIVFSRTKAMEMMSRARKVALLHSPRLMFTAGPGSRPFEATQDGLVLTCAVGGPDFVVLNKRVWPNRAGPPLSIRVAGSPIPHVMYLYACASVRRDLHREQRPRDNPT